MQFHSEAVAGQPDMQRVILERARELVAELGTVEGYKRYLDEYFNAIGVTPNFEAVPGGSLDATRERLKEGGGLLICNHPEDRLDIASVIRIVTTARREDLKFLVNSTFAEQLVPFLGNELIMSVPEDMAGVKKMYAEARAHIENKGLFIIFPSGGDDRIAGANLAHGSELPQISFKGLAPALFKRLMSEDGFVYSVYVDPVSVAKVLPSLEERISSEYPKPSRLAVEDPREFRVVESCLSAGDWQRVLAEPLNPAERSNALTKFYLKQFGVEYRES